MPFKWVERKECGSDKRQYSQGDRYCSLQPRQGAPNVVLPTQFQNSRHFFMTREELEWEEEDPVIVVHVGLNGIGRTRNDVPIFAHILDSVYGDVRYSIPEELQNGAFVGNIAKDLGLDVGKLSTRKFRLVSEKQKKYLDVSLKTGVMFVNEKIDREELCEQTLACVLTLEAVIENPFKLYHIDVEILDINDNPPAFQRGENRFEISEMASPGARFPLQSAHDPDSASNSVRTYGLSQNPYFVLDLQLNSEQTITPELVLQNPLDRELQATHRLTLTAIDGGSPNKSGTTQIMIIVVDANDNLPVFDKKVYQIVIAENVLKGSLIAKINATDLDEGRNGEVMYSFSDNTADKVRALFSINSENGEIRINEMVDFEAVDNYELTVQAKDRGSAGVPAYCKVLIKVTDVNDNAPGIMLTSVHGPIPEGSPLGTLVAILKITDRDSKERQAVYCHVSNNVPFKLDSSFPKYYTVVTDGIIDREKVSEHNITITCMDTGKPPLSTNKTIPVQVSDTNDNAPRFTQPVFTTYVTENNAVGASIGFLSAVDPDINQNGRLAYIILDSLVHGVPVSTFVSVDSDSGVMFAQRSFDYEQVHDFQISVQVKDAGSPSLSSNVTVNVIIVDQNDNVPVILSPMTNEGSAAEETMPRSAAPGYLVIKVTATDADSGQNAHLFYQLGQPTDDSLFTVVSETGEIWTTRRIGVKDSLKQKLVILVRDNGKPSLSSTVSVNLSVLDTDVETASNVAVLGNSKSWTHDVRIYLIISFATISFVSLVAIVILAMKMKGAHGCCSSGTLSCSVRRDSLQGVQKASANLQIPVNYTDVYEREAVFHYDVCPTSKSSMNDFTVLKLHGSPASMINAKNGSLLIEHNGKEPYSTVKETQEMGDVINYPFSKWHILCGILLYASDSTCAYIRYSIPEELEPGAFVGGIARDLGLDAAQLVAHRFRIVSEQKVKYLDVNYKTGTLVINKKIDREQHCHQDIVCVMRLDAVIENPVKLYRVEIEITDINDNSPVFDRREFSFEISEMTSPGSRFRLQNANDPDAGTNSVRTYELSRNEHFILDLQTNKEQTGTPNLVLGRSLDREQQPTHQLTLKAIDGGTPRRTGTTRIAITVVDVNDNAPVFEQDFYQVTIPEDVPAGLLLLQVKAVDMDEGLNGEVVYSFSDNTPSTIRKRFRVDAGSGEIKVIGSLDFEEAHDYAISVQAKDRGSVAVAAYCKVMVSVADVNDNAPEITVASTFNPFREQAPLGTAVILIKVIDPDSDEKGEVSCRVGKNSPFKLDSSFNNYYTVVTMSDIDRETNPEYNITVTCEDGGSPPLQTSKTIPVQVSDINDNAPRFTQPSFTINVMENNAMGFSIGSVSAFDPDYTQNSKLSYNILDSLVHGLSIMSFVSINSASGAIYAEKSFDYEQMKKFQVHVQVKDAGFPQLGSNASVNVIITDQNDNAPVILSPLPREGSATEDIMPKTANSGYLLAKVTASDADSGQNAQISYHILQPTPETGEIWTIRRLEQKDSLRQKIVILVKDGGTPSLSSTVTINISVLHGDTENASSIGLLGTPGPWKSDLKCYLIISFGITSFILLLAIVILGIKVHRGGRKINSCCWNMTYFSRRGSLRGIQKASVNLQIPPGYTDAYESDTFPQSFRYEVGPDSAMNDFIKLHGSSAPMINIRTGICVAAEHGNASKPANKETTTFQEADDQFAVVCLLKVTWSILQIQADSSKEMTKCSGRSSTTPSPPNTVQYRRNEQQSAPCLHRQNKAREDLYQETKRRVSTVVPKIQLFTWITQEIHNKGNRQIASNGVDINRESSSTLIQNFLHAKYPSVTVEPSLCDTRRRFISSMWTRSLRIPEEIETSASISDIAQDLGYTFVEVDSQRRDVEVDARELRKGTGDYRYSPK
ncbi:uncharacterized protein LOC144685372 [Cetorhinus maximus]